MFNNIEYRRNKLNVVFCLIFVILNTGFVSSDLIFPSSEFLKAELFSGIVQSIVGASSIKEKAILYLGRYVGTVVGFSAATFDPVFLITGTPANHLPSLITHKIATVTGYNGNYGIRNISLVVLTASIGLWTLSAYISYQSATSLLVKGFIAGTHSIAMMFFSYLSNSAPSLGLLSLRTSLKELVVDSERFIERDSLSRLIDIAEKAETVSSVAFFVSSIAFTVLLQNPILANAIAYPITAITNILAQRILEYSS